MKGKLFKYLSYFNIMHEREDSETVHAEVEKGVVFKGTNLWVLMCAILLASVGLNMNSTAVIIGAMLISPLMGPINGMGYSLATYDFALFRKAVKNFSFAVIVSLLTSAVYFFISPVNTAHSELLARTSPTIYDVFIALFGGVAGMLALSSKLKGNVIPGVAIATALMPPICTAGYGLATLQINFFFGALYLFTINTVFIAVASMAVSQFLKFPIRTIVEKERAKRVDRYITAILLITAIPSIYFGYQLVQNEKFSENARKFISRVSVFDNSYLFESTINPTTRSIRLLYSGFGVSDSVRIKIKNTALALDLDTGKLSIHSGTDERILKTETEKILTETEALNNKLAATNFLLQQAQSRLDSVNMADNRGKIILAEIQEIYPQVSSCSYSVTYIHPDTVKTPIIVFTLSRNLNRDDRNKITNWAKSRSGNSKTKVCFEQNANSGD